jgi:hypothetical protein
MAFADPQSVTINAIAKSLPRTSSGVDTGSFTKDDGEVKLTVSHAYNKRTRRLLRLDHKKLVTDVLDPTIMSYYNMSTMLIVETPIVGYTLTEAKQVVDGLTAYLTASSGARVTQLLGGEN